MVLRAPAAHCLSSRGSVDIGEGELNRLGVIRALPNMPAAPTCSAELFLVLVKHKEQNTMGAFPIISMIRVSSNSFYQ